MSVMNGICARISAHDERRGILNSLLSKDLQLMTGQHENGGWA
jgi:hypothetical protein